jgi:hypothetical protein
MGLRWIRDDSSPVRSKACQRNKTERILDQNKITGLIRIAVTLSVVVQIPPANPIPRRGSVGGQWLVWQVLCSP